MGSHAYRPQSPPAAPDSAGGDARARRLRAPLLLGLAFLLAIESIGGIVIFVARLTLGVTPFEALHVWCGIALTACYAIYQVKHWHRVAPFRARLDYAIGLIASIFMAATNLTGLVLAFPWWETRIAGASAAPVAYPPLLSAAHNIGSMLVLTFVGAHLGAVLMRDRRPRPSSSRDRS